MSYVIYCKTCGKKLLKYEGVERRYKSPISRCKKCGVEYLDPRCHEIALEGIPQEEFKITGDLVLFVIGALITWRGIYLYGMQMLGTPPSMQWLVPTMVLILGIVLVTAAIVDILRILTGLKRRKFDKLFEASRMRIQNDTYMNKLKEFGYIK